ncbi:MAG TPA: hypothetical protein VLF17_07120 [Candidatus Nitrosotenuis sp.]|nr:hypothetical protein [Candidatus Nitrosotenuis sp.]
MKISQLLCLVLLGISIVGCQWSKPATAMPEKSDEADLLLGLKLDKNAYQLSEPIIATLSLSKGAKADQLINTRLALNVLGEPVSQCDVGFIVMTPSGRSARFLPKIRVRRLRDNDFMILDSAHPIQVEYDLKEFYLLDETGTYIVSAIYQNQSDPQNGLSAWKGQLESNTLQFEIK